MHKYICSTLAHASVNSPEVVLISITLHVQGCMDSGVCGEGGESRVF